MVKYFEYLELGYSLLPEETAFRRLEAMAAAIVGRLTFGRVTRETLRPPPDAPAEEKRTAVMNRRGICEIIDALYIERNPALSPENKVVASFSNNGYSETYAVPAGNAARAADGSNPAIGSVMSEYFTCRQLYRGAGNV